MFHFKKLLSLTGGQGYACGGSNCGYTSGSNSENSGYNSGSSGNNGYNSGSSGSSQYSLSQILAARKKNKSSSDAVNF